MLILLCIFQENLQIIGGTFLKITFHRLRLPCFTGLLLWSYVKFK